MTTPMRRKTFRAMLAGAGIAAIGLTVESCSRPSERKSTDAASPLAAAAPASYEGMYDVANCNGIMAWAWDSARPDESIAVDVYDGEKKIATMTAADFREDLKAAGKGNGKHSLTLTTPSSLKDGKPHRIVMRFAGTTQELLGDRKEITCKPE